MVRTRRLGRTALLVVSATLLFATACTSSASDTWHLRAKKGSATVGERVTLLPAEKQITHGCALGNDESVFLPPQDLDWTVTPSTGRVVDDYFVADEPGTYKLAPRVSAASAAKVAGATRGMPLGPTMTIKVLPDQTQSTETTGPEIQASMDTSGPSADAGAPLAGTWSYIGMVARGTGSSATWSKSPNPGILVIEKKADGYYLQISEGTSKAVLDGDKVTLERNFPSLGVAVRYNGVLSGDTITGTQHTVANKAAHDDAWRATRVR